jgi:hypothetical protein
MGARFIFRKKFSPVVETVEHRTPPRLVGRREGGAFGYFWRPAGTRSVEIRAGRYLDRSKDYRGRLGAKDKARQARALASANG